MTSRTTAEPEPPAHIKLRKLARDVEKLGVVGKSDPESICMMKWSIAQSMRRIARELEGAR